MSAFACASPLHVGERAAVYLTDRCEKRIEYRRHTDQGRERVVKLYDICIRCVEAEAGGPVDQTASLLDGAL